MISAVELKTRARDLDAQGVARSTISAFLGISVERLALILKRKKPPV